MFSDAQPFCLRKCIRIQNTPAAQNNQIRIRILRQQLDKLLHQTHMSLFRRKASDIDYLHRIGI